MVTLPVLLYDPDIGEVIVMTGAMVSTIKVTEAVFVLPALSVALTMTACEPSARDVNVSLVPVTVLHGPVSSLSSILAKPEPLSLVAHITITLPVLLYEPEVGEDMLMLGATVSTVNVTETVFTLPALSVALT